MSPSNKRIYRVRCQSGLMGWRSRLQTQYIGFNEFSCHCDIHKNHTRLGYHSPYAAWEDNPVIEGSTNPSDYRIVTYYAQSLVFEQRLDGWYWTFKDAKDREQWTGPFATKKMARDHAMSME